MMETWFAIRSEALTDDPTAIMSKGPVVVEGAVIGAGKPSFLPTTVDISFINIRSRLSNGMVR